VLTVLALIIVLGLGVRQKRLNVRSAAMGLVFWIFSGLLAGMLVAAISWTLAKAGITKAIFLSVYNQETYSLGLTLLAIAVIVSLYVKFRRRRTSEDLTAGGLLVCALFLIPACILAPGTSFVFMWPLWCGITALLLRLLRPRTHAAKIAALLLSVPVIILLAGAATYSKRIDSLSLTACIIAIGLLLPLLAPQLGVLTSCRPWGIPIVAGLSGLIVLGLAALGGGYNARHPHADSISYWLDADSGKAAWLSFDETPDVWTSEFLRGTLERGKFGRLGPGYLSKQRLLADFPTLRSEAPALKLPAPEVLVLRDSTERQNRSLLLHIISPRRARVIWVAVERTGVLRATVNGKTIPVCGIDTQGKAWAFIFHGLPAEGIDLALTIQRSENPKITLMDQSDGLPQPEGYSIKPRPTDLMPSPWPPFDSTLLVSRTAILAASAQR